MKILSLDIGSHSVKALEVHTSFGRYQFHDYHEATIPLAATATQVAVDLMDRIGKRPDKIIVALPSLQFTMRNLVVPSRNKKAIQSAIEFELEDELPFEMEDVTFDYTIVEQSKVSSTVHIAATLSSHLESYLRDLKNAGIDPDIVTTAPWAYRSLLNTILKDNGPSLDGSSEPQLLVHFGHKTTDLYLHHQGRPVAFRTLQMGGIDIDHALAQKYQIDLDEAMRSKRENGFVLKESQRDAASREQLEYSQTIEDALKPLFLEVRQFALAAGGLTQKSLQHAFITGPTSLIPGFRESFERVVRIQSDFLKSLTQTSPTPIEYSAGTNASFSLAAGLALSAALSGKDQPNPINFRKGVFAKGGARGSFRYEEYKTPIHCALAVLVAFFISMKLQTSHYVNEIEKIDTSLKSKAKALLGTIPNAKMKDYLENPKSLRSAVESKLETQRTLARFLSRDPKSPLKFLKTLSSEIPESTVVDMITFSAGSPENQPFDENAPRSALLSFLVEGPPVEQRLSDIISKLLPSMTKDPSTQAPALDGQGQKWKVTFKGSIGENGYGN